MQKREMLTALGLQAIGSAAVLLATVLLGVRLGPEIQGGFSNVKAEIEFLSALTMFGLPQALFFYVKSGRLDGRDALRWIVGCTALALILGVAYAVYRAQSMAVTMLLAVAVSAMVAHGTMRGLLLVESRPIWFSLLTALPQMLLLCGVATAIEFGAADVRAWLMVFAAAYIVAGVAVWRRLSRSPLRAATHKVSWRALLHYGMANWLTAILVTAAILFAQRWVDKDLGAAALGQFTMAMMLAQVPLTPISYVAPLLFRRWMDRPGAEASRQIASMVFATFLGAAAIAWFVAIVKPELGLGMAYVGALPALAVLLTGCAAEAASRVLTVQASARGTPWIAVRAEAIRWTVLLVAWMILPEPSLTVICTVWAAGAWAAAGVFVWHTCDARMEITT